MTRSVYLGLIVSALSLTAAYVASAQGGAQLPIDSQEVADVDGIPVIVKHLPEWKKKRSSTIFINNKNDLRKSIGERRILEAIDFIAGTEAVTAMYPEGKLLIVEYSTPQASVDTDKKVKNYFSSPDAETNLYYRRIGNYNVFLFDGTNRIAANLLFDQIKYEKVVRWLGSDPFAQQRAERTFIRETKTFFIATVMVILSGLLTALVIGTITGIIFYNLRRRQRREMAAFSDGGGLTRLNLDQLTAEIIPSRFLKD